MTDQRFLDAVQAAHKHSRGWVKLLSDSIRALTDPGYHCFEHPQSAAPVEAVLAVDKAGDVVPAILLEDQSVLVLTWAQSQALGHAFDAWRDKLVAAQRGNPDGKPTPAQLKL